VNLTRQAIVSSALAILDQYGLPDLTMRRLATTLGVQPGALYWHFASKQELLAGMAEVMLADLPAPAGGLAGLAGWARHLDARLLAHHDGAELVWSVECLKPWSAGLGHRIEQALLIDGESPARARLAAQGVLNLVLADAFDQDQRRQAARLKVTATGPEDSHLNDMLAAYIAGLQAGSSC
jgi:AcrR family transcriptional regulator